MPERSTASPSSVRWQPKVRASSKTALGFLSGNYLVCAHKDALADGEKSRQIAAYIQLVRQGYAWARANQEPWARIEADEIGVPVEYVRDQFRRKSALASLGPVSPDAIRSQQQVADVFSQAGLLPRRVDVRPLWMTASTPF